MTTVAAHHESRIGVVYALGAYVLWGFLTLYWKALDEFDAVQLVGWRVVTSTVLLLGALAVTGRLGPWARALTDPRLLARIAAASLLLTANWTAYVVAVVNEQVVETALGYFIAPVFTVLLGVVALRETLSARKRTATLFAVAGIVVLTLGYGRPPWIALTLASTWSVYGYLKRRVPLPALDGLAAEVVVLAAPAVAFLAATWGGDTSVARVADPVGWILVAATGLVTAVPLVLFAAASRRTPLTVLGPMQYLVPTINFLIGWLLLGESVSRVKFAGFLLIWVCLGLVVADVISEREPAR